jgi:hypothetical protein
LAIKFRHLKRVIFIFNLRHVDEYYINRKLIQYTVGKEVGNN